MALQRLLRDGQMQIIRDTSIEWYKTIVEMPDTKPTQSDYDALTDEEKSEYGSLAAYQDAVIESRKNQLINIGGRLDAGKAKIDAGENVGHYSALPNIGYSDEDQSDASALYQHVKDVGVSKYQTLNNL